MSTLEIVWRTVAGILLVGANAFFVAVEFALTRLATAGEDLAEERPELERAVAMLDRLEIHLTGCQLGISTTSVILGVVAEPALTEMLRPVVGIFGVEGAALRTTSVVVAVVILNLVHKIWGEQAPTYLGVERPHDVAAKLAPILAAWSWAMSPVIQLGDGLAKWTLGLFGVEVTRSWTEAETEDGEAEGPAEAIGSRTELKREMGRLLTRGDLPRERREEVVKALEIGSMEVREIMIPRREMACLRLGESFDRTLDRISEQPFNRYPVLREGADDGADDFAGFLYVPALFGDPEALCSRDLDLESLLVPAARVDAGEEVAVLIDRLQEERQELFLVQEEGDVVGMVTVTDALEAIVGEIEDPLD